MTVLFFLLSLLVALLVLNTVGRAGIVCDFGYTITAYQACHRPYTSRVWTLSSLLTGTDDEECVWSIERERGGGSVNHRAKSRDITLTSHAQSANGARVPSNLQSHSQMVRFRVKLSFEVFYTTGASSFDHRGLC